MIKGHTHCPPMPPVPIPRSRMLQRQVVIQALNYLYGHNEIKCSITHIESCFCIFCILTYKFQLFLHNSTSNSYHPYLFFNQDKMSITFVGFNAKPNGDLLDPVKNKLIERASLSRQLYSGLKQNGVNLSENYKDWNKQTMIEKLGRVMGLESVKDPDPSYVLTVDNVIKILAIQMRFRCIMALGHPKSLHSFI